MGAEVSGSEDGGDSERSGSCDTVRSTIGGVRLALMDAGGAADIADIAERYSDGEGYDGRRSAKFVNAGLQMSRGERRNGVECSISMPMPMPPSPGLMP